MKYHVRARFVDDSNRVKSFLLNAVPSRLSDVDPTNYGIYEHGTNETLTCMETFDSWATALDECSQMNVEARLLDSYETELAEIRKL